MKKSMFIAIAVMLVSCKDKEAEKLAYQKYKKEQEKELTIKLNKDFMYYCSIMSFKTKIPLETVKKVLKEYFIFKKDFVFNPNSFVVLNNDNTKNTYKHNYDLINETSLKYSISNTDVVAIYSELVTIQKIDKLTDEVYFLEDRIDDLESQLPKE